MSGMLTRWPDWLTLTVPELRAERDAAWRQLWLIAPRLSSDEWPVRGWYTAHHEWEIAEIRLQTAEWSLGVESHRWRHQDSLFGLDEVSYWRVWKRVQRLIWIDSGMFGRVGQELVVRERGPVTPFEAAAYRRVVRDLERRLAFAVLPALGFSGRVVD